MKTATLLVKRLWVWTGGDCDKCLAMCGLHEKKPSSEPPLHPNCDCVLGQVSAGVPEHAALKGLLAGYRDTVRQFRLLLEDRKLPQLERERLEEAREQMHFDLSLVSLGDVVTEKSIEWHLSRLREDTLLASRIKYRMSLAEANASVPEGKQIEEGESYADFALDKADELEGLIRMAAAEFGVSPRVVRAAFASEYERRAEWLGIKGVWDDTQDNLPLKAKNKIKNDPDLNDFGPANVDYNTALRLYAKYRIRIPPDMKLVEYICTDEGNIRFATAAILEARDEIARMFKSLAGEESDIIRSLNREERDALMVSVYKRGPEVIRERIYEQLQEMAKARSSQKYIHVMEGYKAWSMWLDNVE